MSEKVIKLMSHMDDLDDVQEVHTNAEFPANFGDAGVVLPVNSRAKGANFEREIANLLIDDLKLTNPVKRILEQTRTKELPDLQLEDYVLNVKGMAMALNLNDWWDQVKHLQEIISFPFLYINLIEDL